MARVTRAALLAVVAGALLASPAHGKKQLKVTCEQMYSEIEQTAQKIAVQYGGGYANNFERCTKVGKRARKGVGYVNGTEDSVTGEMKYVEWDQIVRRTKKGRLRSEVLNLTCTRYVTGPGQVPVAVGTC